MSREDAIIERLEDLGAAVRDVRSALVRIERDLDLIRRHVQSHGARLSALECDQLTPIPYDHGDRHVR